MPAGTDRRRVARLGRGVLRIVRQQLIPTLTAGIRFLRSRRQLVSCWPEDMVPLGPDVVVFAHFDRRGAVQEHVMHYLIGLHETGLSVIFVSNSGQLLPEAVARLRPLCAAILVRRNIGYDFGAWREAIERLTLPRPQTEMLVLANDSVYGPLHPLQETFDRIRFNEAPVWGLTESWQIGYHLQSYFLAFDNRVLCSPAWRRFWAGVRPAPSKHWLIRHYEVGLTQAMTRAGFPCKAIWPHELLARNRNDDPASAWSRRTNRFGRAARRPLNPTSDLWRPLLQCGFPFIKRELLRDNPTEVPDIADWQAVTAALTTTDLSPILRDLERGAA